LQNSCARSKRRKARRAAYHMTREVVVFATRQSRGSLNAEANRFLFRLEQEFDLMRLRDRRMVLEYEEARLAANQESLRNVDRPLSCSLDRPSERPRSGVRIARWWRAVGRWGTIWWLGIRRASLAEEVRRLALLEEDIEFALRLRRGRSRG
jgi:hypothetical protein